jgi:hypothetical protein
LTKSLTSEKLANLERVFPLDFGDHAYKKLSQTHSQYAQFIYHAGLYSLLDQAPFSATVFEDSLAILKQLGDPYSDLTIVLTNKYDMHAKALRLIKQLCMHHGWGWEHKRLLDMAIYSNSTVKTVAQFYQGYIEHARGNG